jgi:hypothetical protein
MNVLTTQIVILPKNLMRPPTPLVIKNVAAFLRASVKAAIAELQKLSPERAI